MRSFDDSVKRSFYHRLYQVLSSPASIDYAVLRQGFLTYQSQALALSTADRMRAFNEGQLSEVPGLVLQCQASPDYEIIGTQTQALATQREQLIWQSVLLSVIEDTRLAHTSDSFDEAAFKHAITEALTTLNPLQDRQEPKRLNALSLAPITDKDLRGQSATTREHLDGVKALFGLLDFTLSPTSLADEPVTVQKPTEECLARLRGDQRDIYLFVICREITLQRNEIAKLECFGSESGHLLDEREATLTKLETIKERLEFSNLNDFETASTLQSLAHTSPLFKKSIAYGKPLAQSLFEYVMTVVLSPTLGKHMTEPMQRALFRMAAEFYQRRKKGHDSPGLVALRSFMHEASLIGHKTLTINYLLAVQECTNHLIRELSGPNAINRISERMMLRGIVVNSLHDVTVKLLNKVATNTLGKEFDSELHLVISTMDAYLDGVEASGENKKLRAQVSSLRRLLIALQKTLTLNGADETVNALLELSVKGMQKLKEDDAQSLLDGRLLVGIELDANPAHFLAFDSELEALRTEVKTGGEPEVAFCDFIANALHKHVTGLEVATPIVVQAYQVEREVDKMPETITAHRDISEGQRQGIGESFRAQAKCQQRIAAMNWPTPAEGTFEEALTGRVPPDSVHVTLKDFITNEQSQALLKSLLIYLAQGNTRIDIDSTDAEDFYLQLNEEVELQGKLTAKREMTADRTLSVSSGSEVGTLLNAFDLWGGYTNARQFFAGKISRLDLAKLPGYDVIGFNVLPLAQSYSFADMRSKIATVYGREAVVLETENKTQFYRHVASKLSSEMWQVFAGLTPGYQQQIIDMVWSNFSDLFLANDHELCRSLIDTVIEPKIIECHQLAENDLQLVEEASASLIQSAMLSRSDESLSSPRDFLLAHLKEHYIQLLQWLNTRLRQGYLAREDNDQYKRLLTYLTKFARQCFLKFGTRELQNCKAILEQLAQTVDINDSAAFSSLAQVFSRVYRASIEREPFSKQEDHKLDPTATVSELVTTSIGLMQKQLYAVLRFHQSQLSRSLSFFSTDNEINPIVDRLRQWQADYRFLRESVPESCEAELDNLHSELIDSAARAFHHGVSSLEMGHRYATNSSEAVRVEQQAHWDERFARVRDYGEACEEIFSVQFHQLGLYNRRLGGNSPRTEGSEESLVARRAYLNRKPSGLDTVIRGHQWHGEKSGAFTWKKEQEATRQGNHTDAMRDLLIAEVNQLKKKNKGETSIDCEDLVGAYGELTSFDLVTLEATNQLQLLCEVKACLRKMVNFSKEPAADTYLSNATADLPKLFARYQQADTLHIKCFLRQLKQHIETQSQNREWNVGVQFLHGRQAITFNGQEYVVPRRVKQQYDLLTDDNLQDESLAKTLDQVVAVGHNYNQTFWSSSRSVNYFAHFKTYQAPDDVAECVSARLNLGA